MHTSVSKSQELSVFLYAFSLPQSFDSQQRKPWYSDLTVSIPLSLRVLWSMRFCAANTSQPLISEIETCKQYLNHEIPFTWRELHYHKSFLAGLCSVLLDLLNLMGFSWAQCKSSVDLFVYLFIFVNTQVLTGHWEVLLYFLSAKKNPYFSS